ncbi:HI1506-related protein [Azonexus sp. R2A61]|uniref:HI1506-related protein n=1 Tax=Azonexus sp. R2A61 TaxID=2744443 RepID=UPI001F47CB8A|nr:HI1506-related protein [Azonexus sp. R2A61]
MATKKTKDSSATAKPVTPAEDSTNGGAQALPPVGSTQETAGAGQSPGETKDSPRGEGGSTSGGDPQQLAAKPTGKPPKAVRKMRIVSRTEGFRRCGRPWSTTEVTVIAEEFSAEEIERLKAEPELAVTEVDE